VDINHNILGNPSLKAEYSHNFQGNVSRKWLVKQGLFVADAGAYFNRIQNLITLGQLLGTTQYTYLNVGLARTAGVQGGIEWKSRRVQIAVKGLWAGQTTYFEGQQALPKMLFSPEIQQKVNLRLTAKGTAIGMVYKWNGPRQQYLDLGTGEVGITTLAPFHLWDVSLSQPLAKGACKWILGVNNLLNVQNVVASGANGGIHSGGDNVQQVGWGRSLFMSVNYQFVKNGK
jgi:outer membrane receptor for ferrienterochelin and colicins